MDRILKKLASEKKKLVTEKEFGKIKFDSHFKNSKLNFYVWSPFIESFHMTRDWHDIVTKLTDIGEIEDFVRFLADFFVRFVRYIG